MPQQIQQADQDHGTQQGHEHHAHAEEALIGSAAQQRGEQPARKQSPEDTGRHAQHRAPVRLGSHDEAAEIADGHTKGQPDENAHRGLSRRLPAE